MQGRGWLRAQTLVRIPALTLKNWGSVEKLEPSYIAGRNVKWCSYCGKQVVPQIVQYSYHMIQQLHC